MRLLWRRTFALMLLGCFLLLSPATAEAHGRGRVAFVALAENIPPPLVDGTCTDEYKQGAYHRIQYRPTLERAVAPFNVVVQGENLYFCFRDLPVGVTVSRVGVAFDTAHNGTTAPDRDDFRFEVTEIGIPTLLQGDGAGWSPSQAIPPDQWQAAVVREDSRWSAEFRLPLAYLGGNRDGAFVGVDVRHWNVAGGGDSYGWYPTATGNAPITWGDGVYSIPISSLRPVALDIARVTQGLDYDLTGNTAYRRIAHKDTLVRAQLYSTGAIQPLANGQCLLQRLYRLVDGTLVSDVAPLHTIPITTTPTPTINPYRYGYFNGTPSVDCWIDGDKVEVAGVYQISLRLQMEGSATQTLSIGQYWFYPTNDLELHILRREHPQNDPRFVAWSNAAVAALMEALAQTQRMLPLRRGVGEMVTNAPDGDFSPFAGLRYTLHPAIFRCGASGENLCDSHGRRFNQRALLDFNYRQWLQYGQASPDYVDQDLMVVAAPSTGGGQAQTWADGYCSAAGELDTNLIGATGTVVGHELSHCLGQVRPTSPHSMEGSNHTASPRIGTISGGGMVNFRTRMIETLPLPLMAPVVGAVASYLHEGWEWNDVQSSLQERPTAAAASELFWISGVAAVTPTLPIQVVSAFRLTNYPFPPTQDDPAGTMGLYFFNAAGGEIGQTRIGLNFDGSDGNALPYRGFNILAPVPAGTDTIMVRRGESTVWSHTISTVAPTVRTISAISAFDSVLVTWQASDANNDTLSYSLYYQANPTATPQLIADGITEQAYTFDGTQTGGTAQGRIRVVAEDGYYTASGVSNAFTLSNKAPIAAILPLEREGVAGQAITLNAIAFDYEDGMVAEGGVQWHSNADGALGDGATLTTLLSAGPHQLTVTVTDSTGRSSTAQQSLVVSADSDGDGLPDGYEQGHACLTPTLADSDLDPDDDRLANHGEWQYGGDPCAADTDNDGADDGDEVHYGGVVNEGTVTPPPPSLLMDVSPLLLTCATPTAHRPVTATGEWQSSTSAAWLTATGESTTGQVTVTADCAALPAGSHRAVLMVGDGNEQRLIDVTLRVGRGLYLPLIAR